VRIRKVKKAGLTQNNQRHDILERESSAVFNLIFIKIAIDFLISFLNSTTTYWQCNAALHFSNNNHQGFGLMPIRAARDK